jgi:hypothetical protein
LITVEEVFYSCRYLLVDNKEVESVQEKEESKKQYRTIYENLWETPRTSDSDLVRMLYARTARSRIKEAFDKLYIVGPQIRKRSYENLKEYVYFVNCEVPERLYVRMRQDQNVIYHAKTTGFCDLFVIAKEEMDIKGDIVIEGFRSDFLISYAPDHTWDNAFKTMSKNIRDFDPGEYEPKRLIGVHHNEKVDWDWEDELLYRYFKYILRNPLTPVMRDHEITRNKILKWFDRLSETCTIFTDYFPDGMLVYDQYLFMFETDYEDFIIELFSELPASTTFFKVSKKLFTYIHIPKGYARNTDFHKTSKILYLPLLILNLLDRGIIKHKAHTIVEYFCGKDL